MVVTMISGMFAGCSSKSDDDKDDSTAAATSASSTETQASAKEELKPEDGAKLLLWTENEDYNKAIQKAWAAKYPDVPLEIQTIGGGDARKKLELDGPNGVGCDVFVQPHDQLVTSANSGLILEVDYYTDFIKQNFADSTLPGVTYEGKIYGFPLSVKTPALFYNKALVKEPAKTWDELKEFAKTYNNPSENKFAILWQACEGYWGMPFLNGYGFQMFGPNHDDATKVNFDTAECLAGMEFYKTLSDIYPVKSADATWDAMTSFFGEGKAPYVLTGGWDINRFKEQGIDFGVTSIPLLPNGEHPITFSTVDTVCISSYTEYPDAAMLLAKFLTENDQYKILYDTKHEIPALKDGMSFDYIKNDAQLMGAAEQIPYSIPMPCIPEMNSAWDPIAKAFVAVWDKAMTPKEALDKAKSDFEDLVKANQ